MSKIPFDTVRQASAWGISVLIPVLNEEQNLVRCLDSLSKEFSKSGTIPLEVIVADGGSTDRTREVASAYPEVRLVSARQGRAVQMNEAAALAGYDVLWFLHADSVLPEGAVSLVLETMSAEEMVGGAFGFELDADAWSFRLIEWGVVLRSLIFRVPYGDQGIFVRRETFEAVGGYPEQPILEDLELWRKLRRLGKTRILKPKISTSARRWSERGVLKTTVLNWLVVVLDWCGCSPEKLRSVRDS